MDVAFLLEKYFKGATKVSIDVFDAQTLNSVYKDVINAMTGTTHTLPILMSKLRVCLAYAKSMAGVFLGYVFVRRARTPRGSVSRRWFEDGSKIARRSHATFTEGTRRVHALQCVFYAMPLSCS